VGAVRLRIYLPGPGRLPVEAARPNSLGVAPRSLQLSASEVYILHLGFIETSFMQLSRSEIGSLQLGTREIRVL
jgi:hypothetical protein